MAASVRLAGVSVTHIHRNGPVGSPGTTYSERVTFRVFAPAGIEFDFSQEFTDADDIDTTVQDVARRLANALRELSSAAQAFHPAGNPSGKHP